MSKEQDLQKADMINRIHNGGAWFCTRKGNYLKISSVSEGLLYARECIVRDGTITGGAYTFSTDWFDISFHGRWIDIYIDPDTLSSWDVVRSEEGSLRFMPVTGSSYQPADLEHFCAEADREVLAGPPAAFHLDGASFTQYLAPSEERMGSRESILSKVDLSGIR